MKLQRVVHEIRQWGRYWRADSSVVFEDEQASLDLTIKDASFIDRALPDLQPEIRSRIEHPTVQEISGATGLPVRVEDGGIKVTHAGRSLSPWVMVATMLAVWIGTGSIVGNAEQTYETGMAALILPIGTFVGMILLSLIASRARDIEANSVPEIIERRFGHVARNNDSPSGSVKLAEQFQRRPHCRGVGVIRVVNDGGPADLGYFASHGQRIEVFQGGGHLFHVQSHQATHRHRRQGRGQVVSSPNRHVELAAGNLEAQLPLAAADVAGRHVALGSTAGSSDW